MKYAFIERNRRHWPISVLCEVLEVRGGLTRSDSFLRFLSGTSEAIMLPI